MKILLILILALTLSGCFALKTKNCLIAPFGGKVERNGEKFEVNGPLQNIFNFGVFNK